MKIISASESSDEAEREKESRRKRVEEREIMCEIEGRSLSKFPYLDNFATPAINCSLLPFLNCFKNLYSAFLAKKFEEKCWAANFILETFS